MKKTKPTQSQNESAKSIFQIFLRMQKDNEATPVLVTDKIIDIKDLPNRQVWISPLFVVDDRFWCGFDVYYGKELVIDLIKGKHYTSKMGIFEHSFIFLRDFYGYPEGQFCYTDNTQPIE